MTLPLFSAAVGPITRRRRHRQRWQRRSRGPALLRRAVVFEVGALVALALTVVMLLDYVPILR